MATKGKMGRPPKVTSEQRQEVYEAFEAYIRDTDDPTIVGFAAYNDVALKYNVTDDNIGDWDDFSGLRKRATKKQEAYLIAGGTMNKLNPTFAIFRLKQPQHGWTDRIQTDHTSNGKDIALPILGGVANKQAD